MLYGIFSEMSHILPGKIGADNLIHLCCYTTCNQMNKLWLMGGKILQTQWVNTVINKASNVHYKN